MGQGETLGLLVIASSSEMDAESMHNLRRVAEMTARQLALTLANLRLREVMKEQAVRDPLTNAFNRRYLESIGGKEIAQAARNGRPLAVIMLDVDHFKRFNDMHGHQAGDTALVAVASFLQDTIREGDWIFRYGGEEFVMLLTEANAEDMAFKTEELRAGVAALTIRHEGAALPRVTVSMGVALTEEGETLEAVLARADASLYAAKSNGRNQVVMAPPRALRDAA